MKTYRLPMLTAREWRAISVVIPRNQAGPPPRHDRQIISAVCYAYVANCSFESLPPGYPKVASIRTRVQRWTRAGVLPRILAAAAPAIARMRGNYQAHVSDLSPWGSNWKFNRSKDDPAFANLPRR